MPDLPADVEVIHAVAKVLHDAISGVLDSSGKRFIECNPLAVHVLEAAAPALRAQGAAAEREACAQLAEQVHAVTIGQDVAPFADLIRARSTP